MSDGRVRTSDAAGVRRVALARPEKANALDAAMMTAVASAARGAAQAGCRLLVLHGDSPKGFCAGADIAEFARGEEALHAQEHALLDMIDALARTPLPVLALAHGRTLGAGGILTSLADIVLAADDLSFGFPEIRFNMYPAIVHAALMQKVPGPFAAQLCATGRLLDAREALAAGFVSEVLPAAGFAAAAEERLRFYVDRHAALEMARRARRLTVPDSALRARLAELAPMMMENYRRPGVRATIASFVPGGGADGTH